MDEFIKYVEYTAYKTDENGNYIEYSCCPFDLNKHDAELKTAVIKEIISKAKERDNCYISLYQLEKITNNILENKEGKNS